MVKRDENPFNETMPKSEADIAVRDALISGYQKRVESLERERDALREALRKLSFECSDDLSGPAKRYIDELLAKGADHER